MAKKKEKIEIDKTEWTPERFEAELIDPKTRRQLPFTTENKAAMAALTRDEAIHLHPVLFSRWRMLNKDLNPTKKGAEAANKRIKELKDWSMRIRKLLNDPEITATMINQKRLPKWLNVLDAEEGKFPTPAEVIGATLMAKAMTGDIRAIEELRKMGFGDKVTIDAGESFFNKGALKLEIVDTDDKTKELAEKELNNEVVEAEVVNETKIEPKIVEETKIPDALREEFEKQEAERTSTQPQTTSDVNEHGISRSILNKVVITKNKPRM